MSKLCVKKVSGVLTLAFVTIGMAVLLTGCGSTTKSSSTNTSTATTNPSTQPSSADTMKVSKSSPIFVDKQTKTIEIYTEVNSKYFVEATRHGVVFKDGSNGDKSILKAYANQLDFYNALLVLGAKPGNNLTANTKGEVVQGSPLDVTVTWTGLGKEIPFQDIYTDSTNKPLDLHFGGNEAASKAKQTGCILCLDSCPVGIVSNAAHAQGSFDAGQVQFRGNKNVLPTDGTPVEVIFRLK